jgi:putative ABC transport system ATP-binding protein
MIELRNVCKKYGDKVIFEDLNLKIGDGEFVIVTGESGCGKTTLINVLGGIEKIDSGEICVDGINILMRRNQLKYYREIVGFLFQNFALIDNKTVLENLNLVKKDVRSDLSVSQALECVELSDKANEKIYKLSGGEQQRIALARLMIKKCSIVLADEPTGSLDKRNADKVISLLKKMNEDGKTIIMVTHDSNYQNIGDRVIEL